MSKDKYTLDEMGWRPFFHNQLSKEERDDLLPVRVFAMHRGHIVIRGHVGEIMLPLTERIWSAGLAPFPAVGDWLLVESDEPRPVRMLERKSMIQRMAKRIRGKVQPIAANVDTLFIVSSCTREFNLNRLERYVSLALDSGIEPVIVLTKVDQAESEGNKPARYVKKARKLQPGMSVIPVNALDDESVAPLKAWCKPGQTIAMVGSSGVGKSTLLNTLNGEEIQETGAVREKDEKGRHTTTARTLHILSSGALLMDSPGMRELQVLDCEDGVKETFDEVIDIIKQCRFSNCSHTSEPGCAILAALEDGTLSPRRYENYTKLQKEQARNTQTLAQRRKQEKTFSKYVKKVKATKKKRK